MTRRYVIWEYAVTHAQLLLRSQRDNDNPTRIDVLFKGVSFLHMPDGLDIESIDEVSPAEVRSIGGEDALKALTYDRKGFRLRSPSGDALVVALVMFSAEDGLHASDPSSLPVSPMRAGSDPGATPFG